MNLLEQAFPGLLGTDYRVTSPSTAEYNCIAWAAFDNDRWWWPDSAGVSFWPTGVPREETIPAFASAFATIGFVPSSNPNLEPNVSKIAIYARSGIPTHAARQLPCGNWTSKLGQSEDITHTIQGLEGTLYGEVVMILAKPNPVGNE